MEDRRITRADLLKAVLLGACSELPDEGTWISELSFGDAAWADAAGLTDDAWMVIVGYGYGYGYGDGTGTGDGSGDGYGYGSGYGYGTGDGSGYGYGDGDGYGSGSGYGYGYGSDRWRDFL